MIKGIYTAARGLNSRMKNLEIVANNLANLNTTGFKRVVPFSEIINQYGKVEIKKATDYQQGNLTKTSNPLDFAISGKGFFVIQTANGPELTRDGKFKISVDGHIVTKQGNKVLGKNGPISVNNLLLDKNKRLTISSNGDIRYGDILIDTLLIANMNSPEQSVRTAGVNFTTGNDGFQIASRGSYSIKQGYQEESNINPIKEMEEMIRLNTEYDSAHKIINYLDQSLGQANQIGKV